MDRISGNQTMMHVSVQEVVLTPTLGKKVGKEV